jgi:hypothetical protein
MSANEREGDDGFASLTFLSEIGDQGFFEFVGGLHFAGGDLLWRCADEAEFAMGEGGGAGACVHLHGRAEDAAGHGAGCIEVAEAGGGVERGAGGFVGEVFEAGLILIRLAESAGGGVAGKFATEFGDPLLGAEFNGCGSGWVGGAEVVHSFAEAEGVELADGEGAVTALGAAGAAG